MYVLRRFTKQPRWERLSGNIDWPSTTRQPTYGLRYSWTLHDDRWFMTTSDNLTTWHLESVTRVNTWFDAMNIC